MKMHKIDIAFPFADTMTTLGDRELKIPLPKIGEKSLFTKDLEDALKNGVVDFVVHSLKDLPTCLPDGMTIGAVLEREDPRDALVLAKCHEGKCLRSLPKGSVIGTSSLRRTAQLSRKYPHLKVQDIRGNLNTRLAKLDAPNSNYAGIILAQAGLVRMGWHDRISQTIEPDDILYAVGQGALAVECRSDDTEILEMLQKLICHHTQCRILTERSFLKTLGGGCSAPVAVQSILTKRTRDGDINDVDDNVNDYELNVIGSVWSLDGHTEIQAKNKCYVNLDEELLDECVPKKRTKLDETSNGNKLSPPRVIDHSKGGGNVQPDVVGLINAHADAFKKCPYSSVLTNVLSNPISPKSVSSDGDAALPSDDAHLKCPLNLAVGQDVMGKCPYFDTSDEQNVSKLIAFEESLKHPDTMKSLFVGSGSDADKQKIENAATKCPFAQATEEVKTKCPLMTAASTSNASDANLSPDVTGESSPMETLFCGLFPHKRWPRKVYQKCEQLGQDLAARLIDEGALKVMEVAQNEIRSKMIQPESKRIDQSKNAYI